MEDLHPNVQYIARNELRKRNNIIVPQPVAKYPTVPPFDDISRTLQNISTQNKPFTCASSKGPNNTVKENISDDYETSKPAEKLSAYADVSIPMENLSSVGVIF